MENPLESKSTFNWPTQLQHGNAANNKNSLKVLKNMALKN